MNDVSKASAWYQFFAAYFHQDWDLDADDWEGVVDVYVAEDPVAEPLRSLAQEIDNLRETHDEADLEQLLDKIGVNYDPQPLSYGDWLHEITLRLRQHATTIESGSAL